MPCEDRDFRVLGGKAGSAENMRQCAFHFEEEGGQETMPCGFWDFRVEGLETWSAEHMSVLSGVLRRGGHDKHVFIEQFFSSPREVQDTYINCSLFLVGGRVHNHR